MIVVETARFGQIEVEDRSVISLPRGLFGFEDATEFTLLQHRPGAAFRWLQCITRPDLAFVVVDPSDFFVDYGFDLSSVEAEYLTMDDPQDAIVLTMVSVGKDGGEVTANLVGPIVVNSKTLVGMQVVLDDERYSTKQPLTERSNTKAKEVLVRAA
jgi:flagellar assembly factor FliW